MHKELVGTILSHCVRNFSKLTINRLGYNRSRCTCILAHANKAGEEGEVYAGIQVLCSCFTVVMPVNVRVVRMNVRVVRVIVNGEG